MSVRWTVEPATRGVGRWYVGRAEDRIDVIAAPGSSIASAEGDPWRSHPQLAGWRHTSWERTLDRHINLDRDAPDVEPRTISTREVLELVDVRLHDSIREALVEQLTCLEAMDLLPTMTQDPGFESAAHSELMAIAWVRAELAEAFPDHFPHLRSAEALVSTARPTHLVLQPEPELPGNVEEFESRLATAVYSHGLGGRELARLLKRRIIWRVLEALPRRVLVILFMFTRNDHEPQELIARMLTQRAYRSDWPLVPRLEHLRGRLRRNLAVGWPSRHSDCERQSITMFQEGNHS